MELINEKYISVDDSGFKEFIELEINGSFQMLNLLKFKEKMADTNISGAEGYAQYLKAVAPFFEQSKARIVYHGKPMAALIGPQNGLEWDKILIVEYASKEDFLKMVSAKGYPRDLRSKALEDSRLILCISK